MNDKFAVVGHGQDDHFEELAIAARADHEHLRRISIGVSVESDKRMVDSVDHVVRDDAMSTR